MPQVADSRHGGIFAQPHAALPGAGDHRAIVGDAQPALTPDCWSTYLLLRASMVSCSMISRMK